MTKAEMRVTQAIELRAQGIRVSRVSFKIEGPIGGPHRYYLRNLSSKKWEQVPEDEYREAQQTDSEFMTTLNAMLERRIAYRLKQKGVA